MSEGGREGGIEGGRKAGREGGSEPTSQPVSQSVSQSVNTIRGRNGRDENQSCQVTLDISRSPADFQGGSQKYPG